MTILLLSILSFTNVHAKTNFYEGEYIDNIYMVKYKYSGQVKMFQKARTFRRVGDGKLAYCIEPFQLFDADTGFDQPSDVGDLDYAERERVKKIINFGYGYKDHQDMKWYAVTQMMIWQTVGKGKGDFYFTDTLNGNRKDYFRAEMDEIESLIKRSNKRPSFHNTYHKLVANQEKYIITDTDNFIEDFVPVDQDVKIVGNRVEIPAQKEGFKVFYFKRKNMENTDTPVSFYQSPNNQDLATLGKTNFEDIYFSIDFIDTTITILKEDKDTNGMYPQGDASLDGAIFGIYDGHELIKKVEVKGGVAEVRDIPYGIYTIKELSSGTGYKVNDKEYTVKISEFSPDRIVISKNEVIEKEITIKKVYGESSNFKAEKNIDFEIYNSKGDLIKTISTNEDGIATIKLPYGTYLVKQKNSTKGYNKASDFTLKVLDEEPSEVLLQDLKIPVPDTKTSIFKNIFSLLNKILLIIC